MCEFTRRCQLIKKNVLIILFTSFQFLTTPSPYADHANLSPNASLIDSIKQFIPWDQLIEEDDIEPSDVETLRGKYWLNQFEFRVYLLHKLNSVDWDSVTGEQFVDILKRGHEIASSGSKGERVYKVFNGEYIKGGVLRDYNGREFIKSPVILRVETALSRIEKKYGQRDPFSDQLSVLLKLPGIPESFLPRNEYIHHGDTYSSYIEHTHPDYKGRKYYFDIMLGTFKMSLRSNHHIELVKHLAVFFQYSINFMPWHTINKSYFMNILNFILQRHGLKGIRHGDIDWVAFVAKPETFFYYLWDRIASANPEIQGVQFPMNFEPVPDLKAFVLPWRYLVRFPEQPRPKFTSAYWSNLYELHMYMRNNVYRIRKMTLETFKETLSKMHQIATTGIEGKRLYKSLGKPGDFRQQGLIVSHEQALDVWIHLQAFGMVDPYDLSEQRKSLGLERVPEFARPVNYGRTIAYPPPQHIDLYINVLQ